MQRETLVRVKRRTGAAWMCCLTALCAVSLVALTGCPGPTACTTDEDCANVNNGVAICATNGFCEAVDCVAATDCPDDGLFCTGEPVCLASNTCGFSGNPCTGAASICLEATDECVECESNADCPAGDTCEDGVCVTPPECVTDADCPAGEVCDNGTCVTPPECTTDDDCAAGQVCEDGVCVTPPECVTDDDCAAGQVCEDGVCVAAPVGCTSDADCPDDGLFCNGTEFCNTTGATGVCASTGNPCPEGQTCVEETDTCATPGTSFTLTTEDDAITGTAGDDTFTAPVGTLNPGDIVVGNGGTDTMNAVVAGATSSLATLIDIDFVNFTTLNAVTFDATNCAAIGQFAAAAGSTGNLTLTELEEGTDLAMGTGYADTLTATLADDSGANDELNLIIDGTEEGAVFDYAQNTNPVETLNLMVEGSTLSPEDPGTDFFGDVDEVLVTGSGDLTLSGVDPVDLAANALDTSDFDGDLTIEPLADTGAAFNFTAGGLANIEGIDNYVIVDTTTFNHVVILNPGDSPFNVDISSIDAGDVAGNVTVNQNGTGDDDTINLTLGGEGDGMGFFAAGLTEFINVESGGTTANEIGNIIGNSGTPFVTEQVTITGDQDLDAGIIVTEVVDASAFSGGLTMTAGGSQQITGGFGDDDLTGSPVVDQIDGGPGDDTITGEDGNDQLTGGAGDNTFVYLSAFAGAPVDVDGQDTITDFDVGDAIELAANTLFADGTGSLTNNGACTDDSIDIDNDGTDTTIIIDLDTDGGGTDACLTIVLEGVTFTDADFTYDATDELLTLQ